MEQRKLCMCCINQTLLKAFQAMFGLTSASKAIQKTGQSNIRKSNLELVWNHMPESLVIYDTHEYTGLQLSTIYTTV